MKPILEVIEETGSASLKQMRVPLVAKRPNWHYHPEIELTYMAKGQAMMQVGDHVATCKAGNLMVLGSNLPHDFNPVDRSVPVDFHVLQFRPELLQAFPEMTVVSAFLSGATGGLLLEEVPTDIAVLFEEADDAPPVRRPALLLEILVKLQVVPDTCWKPLSRLAVVQQVTEGENHKRMQTVIEAILDNFHRRISLEEMADLVNMAPPSFSRWFRRAMDMTFTAYVNRVRIEECCRQLQFSDKPITLIAFDCGFESFSSFSRNFRRLKDCTPGQWRSNALG